jgi:hypothetical protein
MYPNPPFRPNHRAAVSPHPAPQLGFTLFPQACNELVKEVKKRPGVDDTTMLVIHFEHS